MDFSAAPAPFLPTAGAEPSVPWPRWVKMFENFLIAVGGDKFSASRKQAVLLTCLGAEGQRVYDSFPVVAKQEGEDEYAFTQRRLETHFAPKHNVCAERYRFRSRGQQSGESVLQWVSTLRQLASTCEYGERSDEFIRDQLIEKTTSSKLRQRLLMEGSDLTLEKSLTIADTLEAAEREAREMEQPIGGAQGSTSTPVHAVRQRVHQRGGAVAGKPQLRLQLQQPPPQQRLQSRPLHRQQQPRSSQLQQSGGKGQCWGCGRLGHFRGDQHCPAYGVVCTKCGRLNHFAQHCRPPSQGRRVVSSVEVLTVGQSALTIPASVEGVEVELVVDSGSPVSLLPRGMVKGDLMETDKELSAYGGQCLNIMGRKFVTVSCNGKTESVCVYVVDQGRALMGLDLMSVFGVNIVDNHVCVVSAEPSSPTQSNPVPPTSLSGEPEAQPAILGYQHRVMVDPSIPPVKQPLRRLPLAVIDQVSARIDQLERQGVVEKVSASKWVSPLVVGRKRDGSIRLCVDMRQVNRAVVTDGYPLPRIEDVLDRLRGSKVFSRLDLKDAYHQLELHPESRELTTFVSHQGLYRYRRVNFGLASAGPCFQRVMASMLKGIDGVEVYLDDILCHAPTQREHDLRLQEVLARFLAHQVRVNWDKSQTNQKEISFLGYLVSAAGVTIDPERIRPLLEAPDPRDERGLRAFLGAVGYHAKFVPRFSELVEPLRAALRADAWEWTAELSDAVQRVKQAVREAPALSLFDPGLPTVLETDASDIGCGACVTQTDLTGARRVIAYASKSFSATERNYSVVEKEALACVWACEKFRHYLWGRRFTLLTDHQALCTIFGTKGSNRVGRRIARWEARLLEFSFQVQYVRSANNAVADGLSRLPVAETWWPDDDDVQIAALTTAVAISETEFEEASAVDEQLGVVQEYVKAGWPRRRRDVDQRAAGFHQIRHELSSHGSLLFRGDRLVVPEELRPRVLSNAHEGHQGVIRTKQRLRERFWWPRLDREAEDLLKGCEVCAQHDGHVRKEKPPLQPIPLPDGPWQRLMIDVIGPMRGPQSERYGVVLCDMYSRWPEVALCPDATADTIVHFLEKLFCREGLPLELVSDNGPAFRSAQLGEFLSKRGVRQTFSSPYSPQSCGLVERMNRTVKEAIQSARLAREPRAGFLRRFLAEYRATAHPATGESPFVLMRGREPRTALDVAPSRDDRVREHHRRYQADYKSRYDRTATAVPRWKTGDWVRVRRPVSGRVEGQQSVQIGCRTGPVSFKLTTGERVHARRLVPGVASSGVRAAEDPDGGMVVPPAVPLSSPSSVSTARGTGEPQEPSAGIPLTPRTPQPVPSPRRGERHRKAPDRYSP